MQLVTQKSKQNFERLVSNPNLDFLQIYLEPSWIFGIVILQTVPKCYTGPTINQTEILYKDDLEPAELLYHD